MEAAYKYPSLTTCFTALRAQVEAITDVQEVNYKEVVSTASELAKHAALYRRELCKSKDDETFKQTLKRVEIPQRFPLGDF